MILVSLLVAWYAPNTQQIMISYKPALMTYNREVKEWGSKWLQWRPTPIWTIILGLIFLGTVIRVAQPSDFLYFNF